MATTQPRTSLSQLRRLCVALVALCLPEDLSSSVGWCNRACDICQMSSPMGAVPASCWWEVETLASLRLGPGDRKGGIVFGGGPGTEEGESICCLR